MLSYVINSVIDSFDHFIQDIDTFIWLPYNSPTFFSRVFVSTFTQYTYRGEIASRASWHQIFIGSLSIFDEKTRKSHGKSHFESIAVVVVEKQPNGKYNNAAAQIHMYIELFPHKPSHNFRCFASPSQLAIWSLWCRFQVISRGKNSN